MNNAFCLGAVSIMNWDMYTEKRGVNRNVEKLCFQNFLKLCTSRTNNV